VKAPLRLELTEFLDVQDLANAAISQVAASFSSTYPDAQVVVFPFADVQRNFAANFNSLGFANAVDGCTSDFAITQYATGDLYSLANPTFTAEGAKVGFAAFLRVYG
jgi:phage/plasmid primase-like uncharacterized protein